MPPIIYCDDSMMAYRSSRKIFQPGERVVFDEGYRLAHLPLVNAGHPAVIREIDGRDYRNGTYEKTRYALVMPISADAFLESDQVQALELAMKSSGFAPKIAWEMCELRRSKLHATLASGISEADLNRCAAAVQNLLDEIGSISVCLKGPFQGTRNTGRIYFPVYPQNIRGEDPFALVQKKHRHSSDETLPRRILSYEPGTRSAGNERTGRTDRSVAGSDCRQGDHSFPGIACHQR